MTVARVHLSTPSPGDPGFNSAMCEEWTDRLRDLRLDVHFAESSLALTPEFDGPITAETDVLLFLKEQYPGADFYEWDTARRMGLPIYQYSKAKNRLVAFPTGSYNPAMDQINKALEAEEKSR